MGTKAIMRISRILFILLTAMCLLLFIYKNYYSFPLSYNNLLKINYIETGITERPSLKSELYNNTSTIEIKEGSTQNVDKWISIDQDIYIFSAYWETRIKPSFVRIIGIGLNSKQNIPHINCALKYRRNVITTTVGSSIITENHNMKHTAMFYFCHTDQAPLEVALFVGSQAELKWLKVKNIEPNVMSARKLAICVQPLYGNFPDNNLHIAEFISYYQLLNTTHFMFYDYKANTSVISLLKELSKSGVSIELLKWNLPEPVKDTWNFAQLSSIADCMYRQSHSHEYVFIVDVDEFLIPRSNVTFQELIEGVDSKGRWSSYMFRQSFFCLQQPEDPDSASIDIKLFTLKKVLREKKVWKYYSRTKSIVRTASVVIPGIHYTWSTIQSSNNWNDIMKIDPGVALLHHYRGGISDEECNDNMVDRSAVQFGLLIINSEPIQVWERWNNQTDHVM